METNSLKIGNQSNQLFATGSRQMNEFVIKWYSKSILHNSLE